MLEARSDLVSKKLAALLRTNLKWAGPRQEQGVIGEHDLLEIGGEEAVTIFREALQQK